MAIADDPLREFYDRLSAEGDLEQLRAEGETESIHLEFKTKKDSSGPEIDKGSKNQSDRWQFSRALSGFANSDGGVLVWGVETDKDSRASGLVPITDHVEFANRLKKLLLDAVQPMVDDVEIATIPTLADPRRGYVKCLIPRSEKTPHRAMLADREYYRRSIEGFYRLEHWDLEDMFGRRPVPRLSLICTVVTNGYMSSGGETTYRGFAVPTIRNSGRGSARAPYIGLTIREPYAFSKPTVTNKVDGLSRHDTPNERTLVFTSNDVTIHPDLEHPVTFIPITAHAYQTGVVIPQDFRLLYELSAENARVVREEFVLGGREIARALVPSPLSDNI